MKLEKKHWAMLVAGVVILFLVYWFFFRKKKTESSYNAALPLIGGNESGYDSNLLIYGSGMGAPSESGYTALAGPVTRKTLLGGGTPVERKYQYYKSGSGSCFHSCEELPAAGGGVICKCPTD